MNDTKPLGPIEHVIVLMYENRSFDNILGGLYPHSPHFEGVPNGWSNPGSAGDVPAFQACVGPDALIMPYPDPNEDYSDMAEQIDGGTMKGFVKNYEKIAQDPNTARNIMQYYAAGNIPITSALAMAYAVSDQYFGSGPVQTWANRLFAHCATPGEYLKDGKRYAYLNNVDYPNYNDHDPFEGQLDFSTIFELLDTAGAGSSTTAWKVYYDDEVPISAFLKYVDDHWDYFGGNVWPFESEVYDDFFSDIKANNLPTYSFIEPRYQKYSPPSPFGVPPNSNHPGDSTADDGGPPISIHYGELMLKKIFEALIAEPALFEKTLFLVTYDEHGGLSDHVPPPPARPPFQDPTGIANFNYNRYGPRVPAIFINPFIEPGTVFRPDKPGTYFDHTSIISTLRAQFGLGGPLTSRDASAPVFEKLIDPSRSPNFGPSLPPLGNDVPLAYHSGEPEPATYTPPARPGTLADAVYRSYRARRRGWRGLLWGPIRRILFLLCR